MTATLESKQTKPKGRAAQASAALGPVGYLFGSGSTARVLDLFTSDPDTPRTLGEISKRFHVAKATAQRDLRTLMRATLIRREGTRTNARYRYAADEDLGRAMLATVRLSRQHAATTAASRADIPWLADLARQRAAGSAWMPFGTREEEAPSDEVTERVLAASALLPEGEEPRPLVGLHTRR
jgi:DNA-binding MarR family transcriptional regulator